MRCESGALTTATVVETGKGQHRGAKASANEEHIVPHERRSRYAVWQSGFLLPPNAPEQEQSGAERHLSFSEKEGGEC
jgi:hypothetical protein